MNLIKQELGTRDRKCESCYKRPATFDREVVRNTGQQLLRFYFCDQCFNDLMNLLKEQ